MVKETFLMDNNEVWLLIAPTFHSAEVDRFLHDTHTELILTHYLHFISITMNQQIYVCRLRSIFFFQVVEVKEQTGINTFL